MLGRVENIVGKGENAGNQHFLLFPKCFQKPPFLGTLSRDCVIKSRVTFSDKLHLLQVYFKAPRPGGSVVSVS